MNYRIEDFLAPSVYNLTDDEKKYELSLINEYLSGNMNATHQLTDPILPYKNSVGKVTIKGEVVSVKNSVHLGQLKLLISEVIALSMLKTIKNIIYVGAAPGTHIKVLAFLFREIQFILFDPADFDLGLTAYQNVTVNQRIFTDDDVDKFRDWPDTLFISDIRTGSVNVDNTDADFDENFEKCVEDDMIMQMNWKIRLNLPALLKFRLPYVERGASDKMFEYLDGEIIVPPFGRPTSSETRLLVTKNVMKIYSCKAYEDSCYTHNFKRMFARYNFDPTPYKFERLCNCHDCTLFIQSLESISEIVKKPVNIILKHIDSLVKQKIKAFHMPYNPRKIDYEYLFSEENIKRIVSSRVKRDQQYASRYMPLKDRKIQKK